MLSPKLRFLTVLLMFLPGLVLAGCEDTTTSKQGTVLWSKQLGTAADDSVGASAVVVDGHDNVYVVGSTGGTVFAPSLGEDDIFVAKYDNAGNLIWGKQFGSDADDYGYNAAIDAGDNLYIVGATTGDAYAPNAVDYYDALLLKISAQGSVIWGRQFGADKDDEANDIAVDSSGCIYVVGETQGVLFGGDPDYISSDGFVAKYDSAGSQIWGSQLTAAEGDTTCDGVEPDGAGGIYVCGQTSELYPPCVGWEDAFLARFGSDGSLVWGRQFGTEKGDYASTACVDKDGNICVVGVMDIDSLPKMDDAGFVAKYDGSGTQLWLKQLYSPLGCWTARVMSDPQGNFLVSGGYRGTLMEVESAGDDAFLIKYDGGGEVVWSEFFSSSADDHCCGSALDASGNLYVLGGTSGNLYGTNSGESDVFIVKLSH